MSLEQTALSSLFVTSQQRLAAPNVCRHIAGS
jgi:hypothetical protein